MPAAAVIPAPIAYTKVVAVKKLVVGFLLRKKGVVGWWCWLFSRTVFRLPNHFSTSSRILCVLCSLLSVACNFLKCEIFTLKKLECSKQAVFA